MTNYLAFHAGYPNLDFHFRSTLHQPSKRNFKLMYDFTKSVKQVILTLILSFVKLLIQLFIPKLYIRYVLAEILFLKKRKNRLKAVINIFVSLVKGLLMKRIGRAWEFSLLIF